MSHTLHTTTKNRNGIRQCTAQSKSNLYSYNRRELLSDLPTILRTCLVPVQAKSNGLLEVTVLISGEHRKRNVPGAAFRKAKQKIMANARGLLSPSASNASPTSSIIAQPAGRQADRSDTPRSTVVH